MSTYYNSAAIRLTLEGNLIDCAKLLSHLHLISASLSSKRVSCFYQRAASFPYPSGFCDVSNESALRVG